MTLEEREAAQRGNRNLPSGLMRALLPPSQPALAPGLPPPGGPFGASFPKNHMKTDWSETMGSGGSVGLGDFPATYSTGSTSCSDFAVFNTGLTPAPGPSGQASIIAYDNLYATPCGNPRAYWAYNTGG